MFENYPKWSNGVVRCPLTIRIIVEMTVKFPTSLEVFPAACTLVGEAGFHGAELVSGSSTDADGTHRAVNLRSAEVKICTE